MTENRFSKLRRMASLAALPLAAALALPAAAQNLPATIRIGLSTALTGGASAAGVSSKYMIDMAVKEINDAGGIAGRKVELFYADDGGDPTRAVSEVKRLIGQEKINVLLGPGAAAPSLAAAPEVTNAKILSFPFTGATSITPKNYPYGFGTFYSSDAFSDAMIDYAIDVLKAKSVAAIVDSGAQGLASGERMKVYAPQRGIKLATLETHDFAATDLSPQVLNLRRSGADVVIHVATSGEAVGRIYATAEQIGWKPTIISQVAVLFPPQIMKIAGDQVFASGRVLGPTFKSLTFCKGEKTSDNAYAKFVARMKAFTPDASKVLVGLAPIYYDSIYLAKAAIEATKSVDGPTLAAWIEQNSSKVHGVGGQMEASKTLHLMWGPKALAMVSRPDQADASGLLPRAGC